MPDPGQIVLGLLVIIAIIILGGYVYTVFVVARKPPEKPKPNAWVDEEGFTHEG